MKFSSEEFRRKYANIIKTKYLQAFSARKPHSNITVFIVYWNGENVVYDTTTKVGFDAFKLACDETSHLELVGAWDLTKNEFDKTPIRTIDNVSKRFDGKLMKGSDLLPKSGK